MRLCVVCHDSCNLSVCYIYRKCSIPLGGSLKVLWDLSHVVCKVSALECQPKLIGKVMLPPYCLLGATGMPICNCIYCIAHPYCLPNIHNRMLLLDIDGLSL